MAWDGDKAGQDRMAWDRIGQYEMGQDGTGLGQDGMRWDGTGYRMLWGQARLG